MKRIWSKIFSERSRRIIKIRNRLRGRIIDAWRESTIRDGWRRKRWNYQINVHEGCKCLTCTLHTWFFKVGIAARPQKVSPSVINLLAAIKRTTCHWRMRDDQHGDKQTWLSTASVQESNWTVSIERFHCKSSNKAVVFIKCDSLKPVCSLIFLQGTVT